MSAVPTVIAPVIERTFTGQDAYFDGNRSEELAIRKIEGTITLRAVVKVEWGDITDDFHYIVCQNNGDQTKPENYLRFRGDGTSVLLECGTWDGGTNFNVSCPITQADTAGDMDIVGLYDGTAWKIYINGNLRNSETNTKGAIGIDNAHWYVGSHNYRPYPRYFKGYIYYVAIYDQVLTLPGLVFYSDNDNNGYIHSDKKNAEGAKAEQKITPCARRLTYFDENKCTIGDVPPDYRRVYLRIQNPESADLTGWEYKIVAEGGNGILAVLSNKSKAATPVWVAVPAGWQNVGASAANSNDLLFSTLKADNTYTDYYLVETVSTPGKQPSPVVVKLLMRPSANAKEQTLGSVTFQTQEAPARKIAENPDKWQYDWIVPSGWKIDKGTDTNWSLTTMEPTKGAIPPMQEGNNYDDASNRGYVFSAATRDTGFKMTFTYSFSRNTYDPKKNTGNDPTLPKTGYLQVDKLPMKAPAVSGDEVIVIDDSSDKCELKKISFVGNSGIKLGGVSGIRELAIIDTKAMVDRIDLGNGRTGLEAFKRFPAEATVADQNATGIPNDKRNPVRLNDGYITPNKQGDTNRLNGFEQLTKLMNAVGYDIDPPNAYIRDYARASSRLDVNTPPLGVWEKLYNMLKNNYDNCVGSGDGDPNKNEIEIYWTPNTGGTAPDPTKGVLTVRLKTKDGWRRYYVEQNLSFASGAANRDGRIYIQSHWGSGVKFENISIGNYAPPADDPQEPPVPFP